MTADLVEIDPAEAWNRCRRIRRTGPGQDFQDPQRVSKFEGEHLEVKAILDPPRLFSLNVSARRSLKAHARSLQDRAISFNICAASNSRPVAISTSDSRNASCSAARSALIQPVAWIKGQQVDLGSLGKVRRFIDDEMSVVHPRSQRHGRHGTTPLVVQQVRPKRARKTLPLRHMRSWGSSCARTTVIRAGGASHHRTGVHPDVRVSNDRSVRAASLAA